MLFIIVLQVSKQILLLNKTGLSYTLFIPVGLRPRQNAQVPNDEGTPPQSQGLASKIGRLVHRVTILWVHRIRLEQVPAGMRPHRAKSPTEEEVLVDYRLAE